MACRSVLLIVACLVHTTAAFYYKNVAVYFVGEPRTLNYTLPSLARRVFAPLRAEGLNATVFVATHRCATVWQYDLLPAAAQAPVFISIAPHAALASPECAVAVTPHLFKSIHSERYARELLGRYATRWRADILRREYEIATGLRFQWFLWVRPDVLYMDPLPLPRLFRVAAITSPDWHTWSGVNDRLFAFPRKYATDFFDLYHFLCAVNTSLMSTWVGNSEAMHRWYFRSRDLRIHRLRGFRFFRLRMTVFRLQHNVTCPLTVYDMKTLEVLLPRAYREICATAATAEWPTEACIDALSTVCGAVLRDFMVHLRQRCKVRPSSMSCRYLLSL